MLLDVNRDPIETYYTVNKTYLKLIREGWQYFELSEKYAKGKDDENIPSHNNRFTIFCNFRHFQITYFY